MDKVMLKVVGMSCGHCVKAIEGSVGNLNGVQNVKVHLDSGNVEVEYHSSDVTVNKIRETIDDQGYDIKD